MFDMWESGSSGKAWMTSQCVLRAQGPGPWGKIDIKVAPPLGKACQPQAKPLNLPAAFQSLPVRAASGSRRE
jgi:hypothetical protein